MVYAINTNTKDITDCIEEIKTFQRGGAPGVYRLHQVLQSIFKEFKITNFNQQLSILSEVGLKAFINTKKTKPSVSFQLIDTYSKDISLDMLLDF